MKGQPNHYIVITVQYLLYFMLRQGSTHDRPLIIATTDNMIYAYQ